MKPRRFDSLKSIRRFLAETIAELDAGRITDMRARTHAILAAAIRECLIKDDLEDLKARISRLEEQGT